MKLPFTVEQFFEVFERYNVAVWPAQVVLTALGLAAVLLAIRPREQSGRIVSAILALLWVWMGLVYHLIFFTRINPLAHAFAAVSVVGALGFSWWGVVRGRLGFHVSANWRTWSGLLLIGYALLIYPALSWLAGHRYPASPSFGLPCPTTIFTIGLLAMLVRPYPWQVFVVPIVWTAVGTQAAFLLSVPQDLGLLVAGLLGIVLAFRCRSPGSAGSVASGASATALEGFGTRRRGRR